MRINTDFTIKTKQRMNYLILRNLLFLLLVSFVFASCSHHEIPVWKITKSTTSPSYLVGTIDYVSKKENGNLITPFIAEKFNNSETFISQINIENSDFIITKQWIEIGMGKTLKEVLKPKDFNTLTQLYSDFKGTRKISIPSPDSVQMRLLFYLQDYNS